jgi:glycosyltransferase involved in cell wall biosynthesis
MPEVQTAKRIHIITLGPLPGGHGGIGAAVGTLLTSPVLGRNCMISHVTSWKWGSAFRKILTFAYALHRFIYLMVFKPVDLVHLHMAHGASFYRKAILALLSRAFRKPYIIQLHSGLLEQFAMQSPVHKRLVRFILDRACAILVLYEEARWKARRLTSNRQLFVLPNPVNSNRMVTNLDADEPETDSPKGLPNQANVQILFMGDIVPQKGILDLLKVIPKIEDHCPNVKFILCGHGRTRKLKRLCEEKGVGHLVEFRGWVTGQEKAQIFQRADIFVLPSHLDELPVAILEAMAYRLPVIATRTGGIPEAVEHGRTGLLIPPGDLNKLAESLVYLIERPMQRLDMGTNGQQLVKERFGRDYVAERLASVYKFCLEKKPAKI